LPVCWSGPVAARRLLVCVGSGSSRAAAPQTHGKKRLHLCYRNRSPLLQEPVAGSAATGGMQPATLNASEPGGQAATDLAAE